MQAPLLMLIAGVLIVVFRDFVAYGMVQLRMLLSDYRRDIVQETMLTWIWGALWIAFGIAGLLGLHLDGGVIRRY